MSKSRESSFSELVQGLPFFGKFAAAAKSKSLSKSMCSLEPRAAVTPPLVVCGQGRKYRELAALSVSGELFQQRVLFVVQAIVLEAIEFGARELFIGHPREFRYEFFVDDIGYQGAMQPAEYHSLLRLFGKDSDLEFQVEHFEIATLSLSLTSNHHNPIVHVGWTQRWASSELALTAVAQ